jgi:hypothetical protein
MDVAKDGVNDRQGDRHGGMDPPSCEPRVAADQRIRGKAAEDSDERDGRAAGQRLNTSPTA